MTYKSTILADTPLRYYRLGESSGTVATDLGSQGQNGTISGGVTLGQAGLIAGDSDTSMLFNGTTGSISLPSTGLPTGASPFSLEMWVQFSTLPSSAFSAILEYGTFGGTTTGIEPYYRASNNKFETWAGNQYLGTSGYPAFIKLPYHLVVTYDGITVRSYINGSLYAAVVFALAISFGSVTIGKDDANEFLPGVIDEVAFYGYALSAVQVAAHYTAGVAVPNTGYTLLPGQTIATSGISNYAYGADSTGPYTTPNFLTSSTVQGLVKSGGFTIVRALTDVLGTDSDAVLASYYTAATAAGCALLISLQNVWDDARCQHIVSYYGSQCLLYEFGNEPDLQPAPNAMTSAQYNAFWNTTVPHLRALNASAKFIGPVTSSYNPSSYMDNWLAAVVTSGVLPNGVSFHRYTTSGSSAACLTAAAGYTWDIQMVRAMARAHLGTESPVCLTEWNFDTGNPPPAYGSDPGFMVGWTSSAFSSILAARPAIASIFNICSGAGSNLLDLIDHTTLQPRTNNQYAILKQMILPPPLTSISAFGRDGIAVGKGR